MQTNNIPIVLTIAGSDSSGGAGIQADIKTISALGCYAASVITVLTAQNTMGVQQVYPISAEFVAHQITSVLSDLNVASIKIGMLYDEEIIQSVCTTLKKFNFKNIIVDPVMIAKNGCELLKPGAIHSLETNLFTISRLITPNLNEAEKLLKQTIRERQQMESASQQLGKQYKTNVLIKGGHLADNSAADILFTYENNQCHWFQNPRIETKHSHGTGCTLSAAIAAYLAQENTLIDAIAKAKKYLTQALIAGDKMQIGHGVGPVDHFYFLRSM